ncbi:ester cyclase [Roseateles violae]|uniref:Ester cyclase n=1 Tax=Roseateles violae TaxID=3058042 RepID=A0ABT8DVP8_9BURK|nr:ester cyclase [Pelomonas sp. PFR6]MDN3922161.1 ester cyclase [Pelomonas sp. PFR6]
MNSLPLTPRRAVALAVMATATVLSSTPALAAAGEPMPEPAHTVADRSISTAQREAMTLAARRYVAFWNTGEASFARLALAPDFVDRTLPPGRPQGFEGPLFASKNFREAVPDLKAEVQELMLVDDRVIARLRFTGHYTGTFQGKSGDGRSVNFIATDIYRVANGLIAENWHIEDNLTLLRQLGVVHP